jgi:competence protein ComEC
MPFLTTFRQYFSAIFLFIVIFGLNISYQYMKYLDFISEDAILVQGVVKNIYQKDNYNILKIKTKDFSFFTSDSLKNKIEQNSIVSAYLITKNITFIQYLKGFYALSFSMKSISKDNVLDSITNTINSQHTNKYIQNLFNALFLAIPIDEELRKICAMYGVSHLVAISGFHLSILSAMLYFIFYIPYGYFYKRYFPYRNKKFDIFIVVSIFLTIYLILTDFVPSLLRAFIMFILGVYFARSNIKIISFETLAIVVFVIIGLFADLLFSLSFWFSVAGVFYIFLFLKYFKNLSKLVKFIFFNIWIYLAMNPIVHFFFDTTSLIQLISPIITLLFTIFYPIELIAHIFGYGDILDFLLIKAILLDFEIVSKSISWWVFIIYILLSFFSIKVKKIFIALNIFIVFFTFWLYVL